jgi:hypothetical protein
VACRRINRRDRATIGAGRYLVRILAKQRHADVLRRFTRTADGNRLRRRFPHRRKPASANRNRDRHQYTDANGYGYGYGYIDTNAFADSHVYGDSDRNGHRNGLHNPLAYSDGGPISNVYCDLFANGFSIADVQRIADPHGDLDRYRHINVHGARKRTRYSDGIGDAHGYGECQCLRVPNFKRHGNGERDANQLADRRGYQYAVLRDGRHRHA